MTEASTGLVDGAVSDSGVVDDVDDVAFVERVHDDITIEPDGFERPAGVLTRAEREQLRRARRRRNRLVGAVVVLLLGAVVAISVPSRNGTTTHSRAPVHVIAPNPLGARAVLVVHYDRARRIDLAALVGIRSGGKDGSFVFLPAPTVVDVPALELQPVGSLLRIGNAALLVNVIENSTGVRVDQMALVDNTALAHAFAAAKPLTITFPHPVSVTDADGTLSYPAGRVAGVSPAQAVRLLTGRESGGTLVHLATVQAVLESYFAELRANPNGLRKARAARGAAPLVGLAAVTAMHYDVFPVSSSDAAGGERYELRASDLDALVRSDFGFARLGGPGRRPRVELLNGVGTAGLTQRIARSVVPAGGEVTLTNNVEGFGVRTSRVVYYDDAEYATARRFARILGVRSVVKGAILLDSVDITVVIGSDVVKASR